MLLQKLSVLTLGRSITRAIG
uniref:Uncharacterized protein n=1 Tax=Arundo donax TaxID=35708 RepID=A0A0A9GN87_ARUDO